MKVLILIALTTTSLLLKPVKQTITPCIAVQNKGLVCCGIGWKKNYYVIEDCIVCQPFEVMFTN